MKKIKRIVSLVCILTVFFFLIACEFREEVTFDEKFGGNITTVFQAQEMGEILNEYLTDSTLNSKKSYTIDDILNDNEDKFLELPKQYREQVEEIKKFGVVFEKHEEDLVVRVVKDFTSLDEINSALEYTKEPIQFLLNNTASLGLGEAGNNETNSLVESFMEIVFLINDNTFERQVKIKDTLGLNEYKERHNDLVMLGSAYSYVLQYTFPYEVTEVKPRDVGISSDKKTVRLRRTIKQIIDNPEELNLTVSFKK